MKVAIFGGTFNPFHIAHAMLADIAVTELGYDRVHIVPAHTPPHKKMGEATAALDRLAMVQAFCAFDRRFVADGREVERGGVSYTYETVTDIIRQYGQRLTVGRRFCWGRRQRLNSRNGTGQRNSQKLLPS